MMEWGKGFKSTKQIKEGKDYSSKRVEPTLIIDVGGFNAWPNGFPNRIVYYQWKCQQPDDGGIQSKMLVQAACACAIYHVPTCTHVLIR